MSFLPIALALGKYYGNAFERRRKRKLLEENERKFLEKQDGTSMNTAPNAPAQVQAATPQSNGQTNIANSQKSDMANLANVAGIDPTFTAATVGNNSNGADNKGGFSDIINKIATVGSMQGGSSQPNPMELLNNTATAAPQAEAPRQLDVQDYLGLKNGYAPNMAARNRASVYGATNFNPDWLNIYGGTRK